MQQKVLIIDDDPAVCTGLKLMLKKSGFEAEATQHPNLAEELISSFDPNLVLLDMNFTIDTSGRQGLRLLKNIVKLKPSLPVILMTGWATVQLAVEGMKIGAKDFIAKPWDNKSLISSIQSLLYLSGDHQNMANKKKSLDDHHIIGVSDKFNEILNIAQSVAGTNASVLISGDSGTGKELIAEYIHQNSNRADQSFVKVNLGGISTSLFESEMFGHKKGSFTDASADRIGRFEYADKGTIFLDEIGELPLQNQVKLLRVLQEKNFEVLGSSDTKSVDFRVISATNKNLENLVHQGIFREDLYYRINLIHIHIPSLHERIEDIPLLVKYFNENLCKLYELECPSIDAKAMTWLCQQNFPGNIRQLKNIVERAILLNPKKSKLSWDDFQSQNSLPHSDNINLPLVGQMSLEEMEIKMIQKTMTHHHQSVSAAARALGLTRSSLYRRLEKYKIPYES